MAETRGTLSRQGGRREETPGSHHLLSCVAALTHPHSHTHTHSHAHIHTRHLAFQEEPQNYKIVVTIAELSLPPGTL